MIARSHLIGIIAIALVAAFAAFALRQPPARQVSPASEKTQRAPDAMERPASPAEAPPPLPRPEKESILTAGANTLSLTGSVLPGAQATLSARQPTRIAAVMARTGESVRSGQALVQLDDRDIQAQARAAQAGVVSAQAQLDKSVLARDTQDGKAYADILAAETGLAQAQAKLQQAILARDAARKENLTSVQAAQASVNKALIALENAQRNLNSLRSLAQIGGVSHNDLANAEAQVTIAQADLDTAREQAKQAAAGPTPTDSSHASEPYRVALAQKDVDSAEAGVHQTQEALKLAQQGRTQALAQSNQDIRAARAALAQAQAQAASAQAVQQSSRLLSPLNGVIANVGAHVGEIAEPGSPLVSIVSLADLYVEALVPARQLSLLATGQASSIRVDTQPGKKFPAYVADIARVAEPDGRTFRVKFRFRSPTLRPIRADQTARIIVQVR